MRIGVLALQGDFFEHIQMFKRLGVDALEVRKASQLAGLDGLIIPGGESTTIRKLIDLFGFAPELASFVGRGAALWGTCAGMIVIARELTDPYPEPLGLIDIRVSRNWFGRQVDSFEDEFEFKGIEGGPFLAVFIRAPVVVEVGEGVQVIASLDDGKPVAVKAGNVLATAFHPELTNDPRIHEFFISMAREASAARSARDG
ncbi:MAG: pyridoxal 5'-phosphate synthase glutaminase subunit PdxT [Chloroflexi bacterium]|nr:pyridoxal 5'-phosphate synthase glutaminase subunit PdxT [Chloroflexota bacterium]